MTKLFNFLKGMLLNPALKSVPTRNTTATVDAIVGVFQHNTNVNRRGVR